MTAADHNARIAELRTGDRWWADEVAEKTAVDLAGGGCNEHGVYVTPESDHVAKVGKATATVLVQQMPCGLWVGAYDLATSGGGSSSLPSVWGKVYDSREECRRAEIKSLIGFANSHGKSCCVETAKRDCPKLAAKLQEILDQNKKEKDHMPPQAKAKSKAAPAEVQAPAPPRTRPGDLPIAELAPSPTNPRKSFPEESLASLADSIRSVGVRQRLLVRPIAEASHPAPRFDPQAGWVGIDHFEVVAGERRLRAATLAGLSAVPVDVCDLSDEEVLLVQLVENDQREDVRPSEQAAAYRRLADAGRSAEDIAKDTGKPIGFVRALLKLGRLPTWALAAVDAGTLPRATAELVARVPGEESRRKCAALVLLGETVPTLLKPDDYEKGPSLLHTIEPPLSYRDTKDLIRNHFQIELKGAPFDRKSLDLLPEAGSCDACPKRAGNDPEATAEGTRADVCLDPDCYRAKVAVYRAAEIAKAEAKGIVPVPDDFSWYMTNGQPPSGWLDPKTKLCDTGEIYSACVMPLKDDRRTLPLDKLLNKTLPQQYLAFDRETKPHKLVRSKDVRAVLLDLGVIPKPKPPKTPSTKAGSESTGAAVESGKSFDDTPKPPPGPTWREVTVRASKIAGKVAYEMGKENGDGLEGLTALGGSTTNAVWESLKLLALWQAEEVYEEGQSTVFGDGVTSGVDIWGRDDNEKGWFPEWKSFIDRTEPANLIGLLLKAAMLRVCTCRDGSLERTREALLAWCELDWGQLEEQARRELAGGEPTEAKVAAAEAAMATEPIPEPATPHVVRLSEIGNFPDAVADALLPKGVTTLPTFLERMEAANPVADLPLRNKAVVYLVREGVKLKQAERAADAIAAHLAPAEPATETKPAKKGKKAKVSK